MSTLALIQLNRLQLALPYPAIAGIENIRDAELDRSESATFWQLRRGMERWSLFTLDQQLQPQRQLDNEHRLALCLKQFPVAITCAGVESIQSESQLPLPAVMYRPDTCLDGFLQYQDKLVLVINPTRLAQRMAHFLNDTGAAA